MSYYVCEDCDSLLIGWDAWVDQNNNIIGGPYDNGQCMDCGSENIKEIKDA